MKYLEKNFSEQGTNSNNNNLLQENTLYNIILLPTISKGYLRWATLITDYNAQKEKKINNNTLNSLKQRGTKQK